MVSGVRDHLAGIDTFAPEFWKLVADLKPQAPAVTQALPGPPDDPLRYAPGLGSSLPQTEASPEEMSPHTPEDFSPENIKRWNRWRDLGERPVYQGDPPKAELLPPAKGLDIKQRPLPPDAKEGAEIVGKIGKLRERIARAEEFQRRSGPDPRFSKELEEMRKELKTWEKSLADRAERST